MKRPEHTSGFEDPLGQMLIPQQCKDCIFRLKQPFVDYEGNGETLDFGWEKGICHIFPYPQIKPNYVLENRDECEYYEKEKPNKEGMSK